MTLAADTIAAGTSWVAPLPFTKGTHYEHYCNTSTCQAAVAASVNPGTARKTTRARCLLVKKRGKSKHNKALALETSGEYPHTHLFTNTSLSRNLEDSRRGILQIKSHVLRNPILLNELARENSKPELRWQLSLARTGLPSTPPPTKWLLSVQEAVLTFAQHRGDDKPPLQFPTAGRGQALDNTDHRQPLTAAAWDQKSPLP